MAETTSSTDQLAGTTTDVTPSTEKKPITDTPGKKIFKEFLNQVQASPDEISKEQIASGLSKDYGSVQNFNQAVDKLYQSQFDVNSQEDMGGYVRGFIDDFDKTISGQAEVTDEVATDEVAPVEDISPAPEDEAPQEGPAPIPDTPGKAIFKEFLNQVHASPDEISKDQIKVGLTRDYGVVDNLDEAAEKLYQSQFDVDQQEDMGGYVRGFIEDFDMTISGKKKEPSPLEKASEKGEVRGEATSLMSPSNLPVSLNGTEAIPLQQSPDVERANNLLEHSRTVTALRPVGVVLPGNEEPSTVLMASADNFAYPTLFPKDPNNVTENPEDWIQLEGEAAIEEARKRGEIFEFASEKEADAFAKGAWKDPKILEDASRQLIFRGEIEDVDALFSDKGSVNTYSDPDRTAWIVPGTETIPLTLEQKLKVYESRPELRPAPTEEFQKKMLERTIEGLEIRAEIENLPDYKRNVAEIRENQTNSYIDMLSTQFNLPREVVEEHLPAWAMQHKINDEDGDMGFVINTDKVEEDVDFITERGFEGVFGIDLRELREEYANKHLSNIGNDYKKDYFDGLEKDLKFKHFFEGEEMEGMKNERIQKLYKDKMDGVSTYFLNPEELEVKALKSELLELENKPNKTAKDEAILKRKRIELSQAIEDGKVGSESMYDPTTGTFVSNDRASQEAKDLDAKVKELIPKYENTGLGDLLKLRDNLWFRYQAYANDVLTNQTVNGLPRAGTSQALVETEGLTAPWNTQSGRQWNAVEKFYRDPYQIDLQNDLKKNDIDFFDGMKVVKSGLWKGHSVDIANEMLANYMAVNRMIALNEDPGSVEDAGFWQSVGEGIIEGLGGKPMTVSAKGDRSINQLKSIGVTPTAEQSDKLRKTFEQKAGRAIGNSMPAMVEVGVSLAGINKLKGLAGIGELAEIIAGTSKTKKFLTAMTIDAASNSAAFGMSGHGAFAGAGEGLGQTIATSMLSKFGVNNWFRRFGAGRFTTRAGISTVTETAAEYSGELLERMSNNGWNYEEAAEKTFGRTPKEQKEKLALTMVVAAGFSVGPSLLPTALMEQGYEELRESEPGNEIIDEALRLDPTVPITETERVQMEAINEKVARGEELTDEEVEVTELVANKTAYQRGKSEQAEEVVESAPVILTSKNEGNQSEIRNEEGVENLTNEEVSKKLDDQEFVDDVKSGKVELDVINPTAQLEKKIISKFDQNPEMEAYKQGGEIDPITGQVSLPLEGDAVQTELELETETDAVQEQVTEEADVQEVQEQAEGDRITQEQEQEVLTVFNASTRPVEELGDRSGVTFMATDKREADAYAEANRGEVREFNIKQSDIADESVILDEINELGLTPENENVGVDEALTYELIDSRFDNSLSEADIKTLFESLKNKGIKAIRYTDGTQVVGGTTESIAIIDNEVLAQPEAETKTEVAEVKAEPVKEVKAEPTKKVEAQAPVTTQAVAEPTAEKGVSFKTRGGDSKQTRRTNAKKIKPATPKQAVLNFFLGGGKVLKTDLTERTGTGGKDIKRKHTLSANKNQEGLGVEDQIPAALREEHGALFETMEDQDISNMILDVLDEHETLTGMADELLADNSIGDVVFLNQTDKVQFESDQKLAEDFEAEVTELSEEFEQIVSDETVLEMEAEQKVQEEQEFNEYIDSLTDEQITEEFGKPVEKKAEKPVTRPEGKVEPGKKEKASEQKIKEATKKLADKIRKGKVDFGGLDQLSTSPAPLIQAAWNSGIETIASTIQAGGTVVQAVSDAVAAIKKSEWYQNLSDEAKVEADQKLDGVMEPYAKEAKKEKDAEDAKEAKKETKKKPVSEAEKQAKKEKKERKKAERNRQNQSAVAYREAKMMEDKGEAQKVLDRTTYQTWNLEEGSKKIDQLYEETGGWTGAIAYVSDATNQVHPALRTGVLVDASAKLIQEGKRMGGDHGQKMMEMGQSVLETISLERTAEGQANAMLNEIYKRNPEIFWKRKLDQAVNIKREQALDAEVSEGVTAREAVQDVQEDMKQEMADMKAELEAVITDLEKQLENAKKSSKRNESIVSQKKRANDMISSGLSKLKGSRGQMNSGIDPTIIEGVAEIVGGLMLKGFSNTRSIINKTYNLIRGAGVKNLTKKNIENIANTLDEFKSAQKMEQVQKFYNKIQNILNTEREVNASTIDEMVENPMPLWEQYQSNILSKVQARVNQLAGSSRVRQSKAELEKLSNKIAKEINAKIAEIQSDVKKRTTEKTSARDTFIDLMTNSDKIQEVYNSILSDPTVDVKTKNEITALLNEEVVVSETLVNNLISEQAGISGKTVADVAAMHYSGKKRFLGTLSESLVRDAGLNVDEAKFVGNYLDKKMSKIIKEKAKKALQKFLAKTINAEDIKHAIATDNITPEIQKEIDRRLRTRENRKLIRRVTKAVNLGALEDGSFYNAFADKFGFRAIDPYTQARFNELVDEIEELRSPENTSKKVQIEGKTMSRTEIDVFNRERVMDLERELNTLIDTVSERAFNYYADNLITMKYMSVLSGINTQVRALSGAIFGLGVNIPAFGARNIMSLRGVLLGLANGVRAGSAASARARLARKGGVIEIGAGIGGFERLASQRQQGASQSKLTGIERQMLRGFEKATKQLKGKRYGVATLNYIATSLLQPLRMFHLLTASDAFFSTAFSEMVVTTEMYNKQAKELGLNPLQTFTGMATKRNTDGGVTNASLVARVQESLANDKQSKDAFEAIAEEEYNQIEDKIREDLRNEGYTGAKLEKEANRRLRKKIGGTRKFSTPKKAYKTRRKQELKENQNLERFEYAIGTVKDWLLIGTPDGIMGLTAKSVQEALSIKPGDSATKAFMKMIGSWQIMFLRLSANSFNQIKTGIPVFGMIDAVLGFGANPITGEIETGKGVREVFNNFFTGKVRQDPQRAYQRLMVASMATTAATAAFYDMFTWDDEEEDFVLDPDRTIDVLGPGHFSNVKNLQKIEDYQKFSFSWTKDSNGNFDKYTKTNLSPYAQGMTAFLSAFSDDLRGLDDDEDIRRRRGELLEKTSIGLFSNPMQAWWEGSFNSMGRLVRSAQAEDNALEGFKAVGQQMLLDNTKAIVQPAIYRDITRMIQKQTGEKKKQATTTTEKFLNGFYGLDFALEEKKDMFGNTYPVTDVVDEWITGHEKMSERHKEVALLYKFDEGLEVNPWRPDGMEKGGRFKINGIEVESTSDEVREIMMDEQQGMYKEVVLEYYDDLNALENRSDLERVMKKLQTKTRDLTKKKLAEKLLADGLIEIVQ